MQATPQLLTMEHAIREMRARLHEELSLEDMAESVCLSPYHFNRVFSRCIGIPPGEFLTTLRIDAAKRLLLTSSLSVTDVCYEVGYKSLGSFVTRFTQSVGVSPRCLRSMLHNGMKAQTHTTPVTVTEEFPIAKLEEQLPAQALTGVITTPTTFQGNIFIGMFPKPIPQGCPIRCTRLTTAGKFHIADIPNGTYYVLCAAFPQAVDVHSMQFLLLPDTSLLVGGYGPMQMCRGETTQPVQIALRPWCLTDPPLLVVLPFIRSRAML